MQQPLAKMTLTWHDDTAVVTLSGEIDRSNAGELGSGIQKSSSASKALVLDLSELGYLDSAALTMVHGLSTINVLTLVAPAGCRARRLVEIAGMDTVLNVTETVEAALSGVQ